MKLEQQFENNKLIIKKAYRDGKEIGRGVFSKESIKKGELLVINNTIKIKREDNVGVKDYIFQDPTNSKNTLLALGLVSLFNHSENKNAYWEYIFKGEYIYIKCLAYKDINKDEEICIDYGKFWRGVLNGATILN